MTTTIGQNDVWLEGWSLALPTTLLVVAGGCVVASRLAGSWLRCPLVLKAECSSVYCQPLGRTECYAERRPASGRQGGECESLRTTQRVASASRVYLSCVDQTIDNVYT